MRTVNRSSRSGLQGVTVMEEAIAAGKATAVINSVIAEPGTGVFLADVPERDDTQDITAEVLGVGCQCYPRWR